MKNLCQAIIWSACFLELSPDDIVDPDSAVKALEDISTALQAATEQEQEAFRHTCSEEALRLEKDAGPGNAKTAVYPKPAGISRNMKPHNAPAPNCRPRFPLGGFASFVYLFFAPPAYPAAVSEARRSAAPTLW
jgi:hypothetical protein